MDGDTTNHAKFLLLSHLIFGCRVPQKAFERQFIPEAEDIGVFLPPFYKTFIPSGDAKSTLNASCETNLTFDTYPP